MEPWTLSFTAEPPSNQIGGPTGTVTVQVTVSEQGTAELRYQPAPYDGPRDEPRQEWAWVKATIPGGPDSVGPGRGRARSASELWRDRN